MARTSAQQKTLYQRLQKKSHNGPFLNNLYETSSTGFFFSGRSSGRKISAGKSHFLAGAPKKSILGLYPRFSFGIHKQSLYHRKLNIYCDSKNSKISARDVTLEKVAENVILIEISCTIWGSSNVKLRMLKRSNKKYNLGFQIAVRPKLQIRSGDCRNVR